jgi:transcriptional regulator with XRE-family HTH domain
MRAAQFRAMREALGLSQRDVADEVGVDRRSVKSWEAGVYPIPADVAEWLSGEKAVADYAVQNAVKDILSSEFVPYTVSLTYYRTQEEYDSFGRDDGRFGISNANARRVADALEAEGIACEFFYPGESESVEQAKELTR